VLPDKLNSDEEEKERKKITKEEKKWMMNKLFCYGF